MKEMDQITKKETKRDIISKIAVVSSYLNRYIMHWEFY